MGNPAQRKGDANDNGAVIAGVTDYKSFAKDILTHIKDKPISFEVFSDEFDEMEKHFYQNHYIQHLFSLIFFVPENIDLH